MATTSANTDLFPRFNFSPGGARMPAFTFGQSTNDNTGANHGTSIFSNQTIASATSANPSQVFELTEPTEQPAQAEEHIVEENRNDETAE